MENDHVFSEHLRGNREDPKIQQCIIIFSITIYYTGHELRYNPFLDTTGTVDGHSYFPGQNMTELRTIRW